jgi:hypothetical protein
VRTQNRTHHQCFRSQERTEEATQDFFVDGALERKEKSILSSNKEERTMKMPEAKVKEVDTRAVRNRRTRIENRHRTC